MKNETEKNGISEHSVMGIYGGPGILTGRTGECPGVSSFYGFQLVVESEQSERKVSGSALRFAGCIS